jgi:ankyrin repeat protein
LTANCRLIISTHESYLSCLLTFNAARGADGVRALCQAMLAGQVDAAASLQEAGEDPDGVTGRVWRDGVRDVQPWSEMPRGRWRSRQLVPLLLEAGGGQLVPLLVAGGLDVNLHDANGLTPLYWCAEHGGAGAVTALTEAARQNAARCSSRPRRRCVLPPSWPRWLQRAWAPRRRRRARRRRLQCVQEVMRYIEHRWQLFICLLLAAVSAGKATDASPRIDVSSEPRGVPGSPDAAARYTLTFPHVTASMLRCGTCSS